MVEKYKISEKIVILIFTVIFVSPAFIVQEGPRLLYGILAGAIGLGIGKKIIFYLRKKGRKEERKNVHPLLSNFAIFIYLFIYIGLVFILDFDLFYRNMLLFLLKILLGGIVFFYGGFKLIQTKRGWLRGFPLTQKAAVIYGLLSVIFSIFILFLKIIVKYIG